MLTPIEIVGWLGNVCFFSRFFYQWIVSERAGRSVAPRGFWWLSLAGSTLLLVYTFDRGEPILLFGYVITSLIYSRNLWISHGGESTRGIGLLPALLVGASLWTLLTVVGLRKIDHQFGASTAWLAVGVAGQAIWNSRFIVQWMATEKRGDSHFPVAFWWLSLCGNCLLLAYALHLGDPVWIAGLIPGPLVQIRNLALHGRQRSAADLSAAGSAAREPTADR